MVLGTPSQTPIFSLGPLNTSLPLLSYSAASWEMRCFCHLCNKDNSMVDLVRAALTEVLTKLVAVVMMQ